MRKIVLDSLVVGLFVFNIVLAFSNRPVIILVILTVLTLVKTRTDFTAIGRLKKRWATDEPDPEKLAFAESLIKSASQQAKLSTPELCLYEPTTKGAIMAATGGSLKPILFCSTPILELPLNQLWGVLFHELGHIHYKHVLLAQLLDYVSFLLVCGFVFEISFELSNVSTAVLSILGFNLRSLILIAYSHYCEYQADRFSQKYAPDCLLEFLADYNNGKPQSWFEPHPSIQARIAAIF